LASSRWGRNFDRLGQILFRLNSLRFCGRHSKLGISSARHLGHLSWGCDGVHLSSDWTFIGYWHLNLWLLRDTTRDRGTWFVDGFELVN
jgi:hypothetical protein